MKLKRIGLTAAVVLLFVISILLFLMREPDLSGYHSLLNPRTTILPDQKVVVVEARGDPNVVGREVMGLLFRTYFSIQGVPKGSTQPAPRARWENSHDLPKAEWIGRYAMPVPDQVAILPKRKDDSGLKVELGTWEYGRVAEILHMGPYDKEEPAITKLKQYIQDNGDEIVGDHEEEYLRGPGMFLKGDPAKYYTIIRYRIKRRTSS